jgi:4'-phosphopantetheinyl transferase EntD
MAFQPLFPDLTGPGLAAGWASIDALQGTLDPAEWQDVAAAAAPRQREFVAGRLLVTALADSLSLVAKPVRRAEDRSPIWPADRRGSLSHCKELCAGVVGRPDAIQSAGIDVEALGARRYRDHHFLQRQRDILQMPVSSDRELGGFSGCRT